LVNLTPKIPFFIYEYQQRSISDPQKIANYFNEFFANAPSAIISDPTDVPTETRNVDQHTYSFTENPVRLKEIVEAVKQLQAKKKVKILMDCRCGL
jgi:hypothetical protein